jgi:hypothetical protein
MGKKRHRWTLFLKIDISKRPMKWTFLFYELIGDVTYLMHPWFYFAIKVEKNGLWKEKVWGSFILFYIWMTIKSTLGGGGFYF